MIRTGDEYLESIRDGRAVFVDGERVKDVTTHPVFAPIVGVRARIYDMQRDARTRDTMTFTLDGEVNAVGNKLPITREDWWDKRRATDCVFDEIGGVVTRVGDETIGEMWSLFDGQDILNEVDPRFSANIRTHIDKVLHEDPFHVSANTDPKGDRSRAFGERDPDMLLRVVRETDAGVVVRGAKFETAAPYANQAFTKPTIVDWGDTDQSDHAIGFVCDLGSPGLKFICRSGFAGVARPEDAPLSSRFDEVEALVVFDDVLVPWENVLFYRHTRAAMFIRATLHRYSAFAFLQRQLRHADMLIGTALFALRQSGNDRLQPVQEKLAAMAVWRESIEAHLTAAVTLAERSPSGLMMPNQSLLYAGRATACARLPEMVALARELCGGQIALTPSAASFASPETGPWLERYYSWNEEWHADDRRRLMAFARDLIDSGYAGHRLSFQLFAQSPPHAHLAAVYRTFDWDGPLDFVKAAAGLSDRVLGPKTRQTADSDVSRWFDPSPNPRATE